MPRRLYCVICEFVSDTMYFTRSEDALRYAVVTALTWKIDTDQPGHNSIYMDIYEDTGALGEPMQHVGTKTIHKLYAFLEKYNLARDEILKNPIEIPIHSLKRECLMDLAIGM